MCSNGNRDVDRSLHQEEKSGSVCKGSGFWVLGARPKIIARQCGQSIGYFQQRRSLYIPETCALLERGTPKQRALTANSDSFARSATASRLGANSEPKQILPKIPEPPANSHVPEICTLSLEAIQYPKTYLSATMFNFKPAGSCQAMLNPQMMQAVRVLQDRESLHQHRKSPIVTRRKWLCTSLVVPNTEH